MLYALKLSNWRKTMDAFIYILFISLVKILNTDKDMRDLLDKQGWNPDD